MKKTENVIKTPVIIALITIPFFYWIFTRYMGLDFWYDEIFSFDQFIFVPLRKTLTDYTAPNNHIFANIIYNLYVKLLRIPDLMTLMDTPYKIRVVPLVYSIVTMGYMYRIGKRFFNGTVGSLALLILATTVPFYNFAVQIRGYSLSMTLVTMFMFYLWRFEQTVQRRDALFLVIIAVLALYTLPLHIYFLASVAAFYAIRGVYHLYKERPDSLKVYLVSLLKAQFSEENRYWAIVYLISIAVFIGVCIYLPLYENFIDNRHFKSHGMFTNPSVLSELMPKSFIFFLSKRYLFIPGFLVGLSCCAMPSMRSKHSDVISRSLCCGFAWCVPFVLSFIRGDQPPSRAFVNLTPVFVLWIALSLWLCRLFLPQVRLNRLAVFLGLLGYCHITFAYNINHIERYIKADIEQQKNTFNLYYNYFQSSYRPMNVVRDFMRDYYTPAIPVTLILNSEEYEIRRYLDKFQVPYRLHPYEILFNAYGQAFVVTGFVRDVRMRLFGILPDVQCSILNKDVNYHHILYCESASIREISQQE